MRIHDEEKELFQTSRWSLRFTSPTVEDAFLAGRQEKMWRNLRRVSLITLLVFMPQLASRLYSMLSGKHVFLEGVAPQGTHVFVIMCVLFGFAVAGAVVPCIATVRRRLGFRGGEALSVFFTLFILSYMLGVIALLPMLMGDPDSPNETTATIKRQYRVAWVALGLDTIITVSHLLVLFRWSVVVWIDILILLVFTAYVLVQPGPVDLYTMMVFFGLIAGASWGLRSNELYERMLFATIVDERTLRAQAEFSADLGGGGGRRASAPRRQGLYRLERPESGATRPDVGYAHSVDPSVASVASTTETAAVFLRLGSRNVDMTEALNSVMDLGVQEQWLIMDEELQVYEDRVLGKGGQASVVHGRFCCSDVAVKSYASKLGKLSSAVLNELRIMRRVRHPNIVLFHGAHIAAVSGDAAEDNANPGCRISLVLERVAGVPLYIFLSSLKGPEGQLTDRDTASRRGTMMQVCQALVYLHSRKPCIVHADVKPDNILVEHREAAPLAKLLDFGLSRTVTRNSKLTGGTKHFIAPEVIRNPNGRANPSADVFSFGRLLSLVARGVSAKAEDSSLPGSPGGSPGSPPTSPAVSWGPSMLLTAEWGGTFKLCLLRDSSLRPSVREVYAALWDRGGDTSASLRTRQQQPEVPSCEIRKVLAL